MATAANIVIADGQASPVNHTFAVARIEPEVALFEDRVGGIYLGYNKLTLGIIRPKGPQQISTGNLKLRVKIETPKLETTSASTATGIQPAPVVSYRLVQDNIGTIPDRSTLQDRKDLQAFTKNVYAHAAVTAMYETFELPY